MPLSDTKLRQAVLKEKPYKMFDGDGLFVQVAKKGTKGGKYWRMRYRFGGKEKLLSFGTYPELGLKEARDRCIDARRLIAQGVDPGAAKQAVKAAKSGANSFRSIGREWWEKHKHTWTEYHAEVIWMRLEKNIFPELGNEDITDITPSRLLPVMQRIVNRGALETAHRTLNYVSRIFRYAIATCRAERDPAQDLRGAIPPSVEKHMPTLTNPAQVGGLLRAIEGYVGSEVVRAALKLSPLLFVRPGELRHAEWSEIDLNQAEWRIPASKMKMRREHIVPLPQQAVNELRMLKPLTGQGATAKYVFPSIRTRTRPMSENTVNGALKRLGYTGEDIVPHGFRAMASTLLREMGWNPEAIERQLAHVERNKVRAAYNRAEYLPERQKMMQAWADYLEELRKS